MTKRKASVALDNGDESDQSSSTQDNNSSNSNSVVGGSNNHNNGGSGNNNPNPQTGGNHNGQQQSGIVGENSNQNSNSSQHKGKKERADNWSSAEIQVLHRGIESRREIFYGPPSQATKKNRELAWEAITKEVNTVSTTPRSLPQVMKKFKNEKCRAKRKFVDPDKDPGSNEMSSASNGVSKNGSTSNNSNSNNAPPNNTGTSTITSVVQSHTSNQQQQQQQLQHQIQQQQQQQQQSHHMTNPNDALSSQNPINVVKLTPQNVAKSMIDLPGHVQQIQMPNDDMVLIVPPEMDSILSGMNIVSDALSNQQHNHHGQHAIQTINAGPSLVNGTMTNGMMARTIPGSMCSLVYSTGSEVCNPEQHVTNSVTTTTQLSTNLGGVNAHNLIHHRTSLDQQQLQHQQQQHPHLHQQQQQQQQAHHQQQQHQQSQQQHQQHQHQQQQHQQQQQQQHQHPSQQQQQQQQQQIQQQPHQQQQHQHHLTQGQVNHLGPSTAQTLANNLGGVPEPQLKNLLFNILLKDGHQLQSGSGGSLGNVQQVNSEYNKQRNDMLAIIASSLSKIEAHLSRISKVASSLFEQSMAGGSANPIDNLSVPNHSSNTNINLSNSDSNNNAVPISGPVVGLISNSGGNTNSSNNNPRGAEA